MDLVTCTGCKHVFSPTAGQRVRCPACMKFLDAGPVKPGRPPTAPPAASPAAPRRPALKPKAKSNVPGILVMLGIIAVGAIGLGIAVRFRPTEPVPIEKVATNPEPPSKQPLPQAAIPNVVDPDVPPPPEKKTDAKTKPLTPVPPAIPLLPPDEDPPAPKAKITPKARPVDLTSIPDPDPLEIKTNRIEFKKIAGVDPEKVDTAIRKGVAYLNRSAPEWFNSGWDLGAPALAGLALLECGTPPGSPLLQQTAAAVRSRSANKLDTYEISLAILFLDRLGNPQDRGLIQTLAARLISGQDTAGGWTYRGQYLMTQPETVELLAILQRSRPIQARPLVPLSIGSEKTSDKTIKSKDAFSDPFADPFFDPMPNPAVAAKDPRIESGPVEKGTPPKILPRSRMSGQPVNHVSTSTPLPATGQTQRIHDIVTVKQRDRSRTTMDLAFKDTFGDLSNSQFAILALWAARRHGVVADRALLLTEMRLRKTQSTTGGWRYQEHRASNENAALCCAGLLGLALGTAADQPHGASLARALHTDESISRALDYLGKETKDPAPTVEEVEKQLLDVYMLWSMERVAMIYHMKTIRGRDWYGWGAQNLIKHQDPAGSWLDANGHSHSAPIDTSLALLFLVRSNLVQEITEQIRLQMPIQEK